MRVIFLHLDAPDLVFEGNFRKYQKLIDSVKHNYSYWATKCSGE